MTKMTEIHRDPEVADAYLDGLATGMQLADTYSAESTRPRFHLTKPVRRLVLLVLVVSLLGWTYGLLELANIVPNPVAQAAVTTQAHHLPAWVHWRQAPGFMRDVKDCGGGPAVIIWGGSGDTSALICKSGIAETS